MADEEAGDETIGDVLTRVSNLNKPEMTAEVEAYGLEVDPDWTKPQIMENFEAFLLEQAEADEADEDDPAPEPDPEPVVQDDTVAGVPPLVENIPTEVSEEELQQRQATSSGASPGQELPPDPQASDVRIMTSPARLARGWGRRSGAHAP